MVKVQKRKIVLYSKWRGFDLECACLFHKPFCNDYKQCEEICATMNPYDDIEECLRNQRSYKRINGAIRQKK